MRTSGLDATAGGTPWTNYRVDGGRLANHGVHDLWPFTEITGRTDLLAELLANEVIVEREIVTPEADPGTKFDIREDPARWYSFLHSCLAGLSKLTFVNPSHLRRMPTTSPSVSVPR